MCAPVGLYLLVFSYDLIQKPEKVTMQKFEKCISLLIWYGVKRLLSFLECAFFGMWDVEFFCLVQTKLTPLTPRFSVYTLF